MSILNIKLPRFVSILMLLGASSTQAVTIFVDFYETTDQGVYYQKPNSSDYIHYLPRLQTSISTEYENSSYILYRVKMGFASYDTSEIRSQFPDHIVSGEALTAEENCTFLIKDSTVADVGDRRILSRSAGFAIKDVDFYLSQTVCNFEVRINKYNQGWEEWNEILLNSIAQNATVANPFGETNFIYQSEAPSLPLDLSETYNNLAALTIFDESGSSNKDISYFKLGSTLFANNSLIHDDYLLLDNDEDRVSFLQFVHSSIFEVSEGLYSLIAEADLKPEYLFSYGEVSTTVGSVDLMKIGIDIVQPEPEPEPITI